MTPRKFHAAKGDIINKDDKIIRLLIEVKEFKKPGKRGKNDYHKCLYWDTLNF